MEHNQDMPIIDLYSDGGADPNPGKGGYGLILCWQGKNYRAEFCQGYKETTNNRMELLGVITGLEKLKKRSIVNVYTDSRYVVDGISNGWAQKWKDNNWMRNRKEKAINVDLWDRLLNLLTQHEVTFHWIKGHNGHPENERCDALATQALNHSELLEDEGYEFQEADKSDYTKASGKIKAEGDICTKCNTPVIKRIPKKRNIKEGQTYYFEYSMYCPGCGTIYLVEEAKRFVDNSDSPRLF